ncbi:MAG: hypothetical protein ACR2PH_13425 [Desulfobulbia bacterium]
MALLLPSFILAQVEKHTESYVSPPIPAEVMVGNKSSVYQLLIHRKIVKDKKFDYFSLISYKNNYDDNIPNSFFIQSVVTYDIMKNLSVGLGANIKSFDGVKPLISAFYINASKNYFLLIQPAYELHKDGLFELFTTYTWSPKNDRKIQPYFNIQALTSFKEKHAFSYHRWSLGIQYKIFRFGPALNTQYYGEEAISETNVGGFINVLI